MSTYDQRRPHDTRNQPDLPIDHSIPLRSLSSSPSSIHFQTSRTKKSRREKPHIELAPDQPLTTQGKPRARVYVASEPAKYAAMAQNPPAIIAPVARSRPIPAYTTPPQSAEAQTRLPGARQRMAREARQESDADAVASRRRPSEEARPHVPASTT
ncbi:hypothetical protein J3R83DRAFT_12920 [Lanmaoa asiatica]|nr:hypothetical protein J3R83DRAFT_12920 [Lanmaoa asiatica]